MKKLIIVLLALCLFAVPVMAQTQEDPKVVNWEEDLEQSFIDAGLAGQFYLFGDYGLQFLVPAGLEPVELTEEHAAHGIFGAFAAEDSDRQIVASYLDYGVDTLEDVAQLEKQARGDNMKFGGFYVVNGLNAILFVDTNSDVLVVNIAATAPQQFIKLTIGPVSDEGLNALTGYFVGSIKPYDPEAAE